MINILTLPGQIYVQKLINVYLAYLHNKLLTNQNKITDRGTDKFYDKRFCRARNSSLEFASINLSVRSSLSFLSLYIS